MNVSPTSRDAELLESALRRGLSSGHESLRELFERRPELRELFERFEGGAELDRAFVESLRASAGAEDARWMRELVAEVSRRDSVPPAGPTAGQRASAAAPRLRFPRWSLLAAGLLIAAGSTLWWRSLAQRPSGRTQQLGPSAGQLEGAKRAGLSCVAPSGAVSRFGVFQWHAKHDLSASETYVVRVYAPTGDGSRGAPIDVAQVRTTEWTPPPERVSTWPASIEWSVTLSEEGFEKATAWASAERSP